MLVLISIAIARAVDEWRRNKEQNVDQEITEEENIYPEDVSIIFFVYTGFCILVYFYL